MKAIKKRVTVLEVRHRYLVEHEPEPLTGAEFVDDGGEWLAHAFRQDRLLAFDDDGRVIPYWAFGEAQAHWQALADELNTWGEIVFPLTSSDAQQALQAIAEGLIFIDGNPQKEDVTCDYHTASRNIQELAMHVNMAMRALQAQMPLVLTMATVVHWLEYRAATPFVIYDEAGDVCD